MTAHAECGSKNLVRVRRVCDVFYKSRVLADAALFSRAQVLLADMLQSVITALLVTSILTRAGNFCNVCLMLPRIYKTSKRLEIRAANVLSL